MLYKTKEVFAARVVKGNLAEGRGGYTTGHERLTSAQATDKDDLDATIQHTERVLVLRYDRSDRLANDHYMETIKQIDNLRLAIAEQRSPQTSLVDVRTRRTVHLRVKYTLN